MKMRILFLFILFAAGPALADQPGDFMKDPQGKEMLQMGWPEGDYSVGLPDKMRFYPEGNDSSLTYWGEKPAEFQLEETGSDVLSQMSTGHYAVIGAYQASKLTPGSYLELLSTFAPEKPGDPEQVYFSRAPLDDGPPAPDISPTPHRVQLPSEVAWHHFILPFDATGAKTHLIRLTTKIHLAGGYGTTIGFDNLRLIQYPDTYFPALTDPIPTLQAAYVVPAIQVPANVTSAAPSATPLEPSVVQEFDWTGDDMQILNRAPGFEHNPFQQSVSIEQTLGEPAHLIVRYALPAPLQITLRTLGSAITSKITSKHYAIVGKMRYEGVAAGSYLEMWSYFAPATAGGPEGACFSRTMADSGPMAKLEGTDDEREFSLPFDTTGATTNLIRLEMNLHLGGTGTVHFWDVKLVQYPDASASVAAGYTGPNPFASGHLTIGITMLDGNASYSLAGMGNVPLDDILQMLQAPDVAGSTQRFSIVAAKNVPYRSIADLLDALAKARISNVKFDMAPVAPPLPAPATLTVETSSLDWRAFLLGMACAGGLALVGLGIVLILRRWQQHRKDHELRRIASLDT